MDKLFYKPEQAWVGDLIPYYDNGKYYAFYLHDPRKQAGEYAEETTWHYVETTDFVNVSYQGEAIKRGGDDAFNKNIYTGSIIKDENGCYHAFYTAFNEDKKLNGERAVQTVMKATGSDLAHLVTDDAFLFASDDDIYEAFDWRDPYVFWVEEEKCYYMIMASKRKHVGYLRGGCISLSKSTDLKNWTYEQPFYDPKMYITMECPEVFKMGNYWYLVFSTFSDKFTTHYRYANTLSGPWLIPEDDVFDTRANYAIKTASDGERRFAFGWVASKTGNRDFAPWDWGGTMIFHELLQDDKTGLLRAVATEGTKQFYRQTIALSQESNYNNQATESKTICSETLGAKFWDCPKENFSAQIRLSNIDVHEFGILLHADDQLEKGYFLRMNPSQHLVAWDLWPRSEQGNYQWQIKGDVPYQIETSRLLPQADSYDILIVREADICVVYINDQVALSTRLYDHKAGKVGVFIIQGELTIDDMVLKETT